LKTTKFLGPRDSHLQIPRQGRLDPAAPDPARARNYVWNYCCEVHRYAMKWQRKWLSAFDWIKLCTGNAAELGLHSDTVQTICREFAARRDTIRRGPGWRSAKKSLDGLPFSGAPYRSTVPMSPTLRRRYQFWLSPRDRGEIKSGFRADARGR
jgi:putative transposase